MADRVFVKQGSLRRWFVGYINASGEQVHLGSFLDEDVARTYAAIQNKLLFPAEAA